MRSKVHFNLLVSAADASTVTNAIQTDLGNRQIFDRDMDCAARVVLTRSGLVTAVSGRIRFTTAAEASAFWDRVVSRWTSGGIAARILAGSWLERHDCPHDEASPTGCSTQQRLVK